MSPKYFVKVESHARVRRADWRGRDRSGAAASGTAENDLNL